MRQMSLINGFIHGFAFIDAQNPPLHSASLHAANGHISVLQQHAQVGHTFMLYIYRLILLRIPKLQCGYENRHL